MSPALTTKDLEGKSAPEQKPKPTLTLEDVEKSPLGRELLAEKEAQQTVAQEVVDTKREEDIAAWTAELDTVSGLYEPLRERCLDSAEALALDTEKLGNLRNKMRILTSQLMKAGEHVVDPVLPLSGQPKHKLCQELHNIRTRLPVRV